MGSPAQSLFAALREHSSANGAAPSPSGENDRWKDAVVEVIDVAKQHDLWLSLYPREWCGDHALWLHSPGAGGGEDVSKADKICEFAYGSGGVKSLRCDGQEHRTVAQFQRHLFTLLIEASEGIKRTRRLISRMKTIVRCRECNRFLCEVEVLMNPVPVGKLAQISNVRCKACGSESSATIEVREVEA